jgi:hypothetical protein
MEIVFIDMVKELGLMVALVVFFTWQGWKRETRLNNRLSALEDDYTSTLKELVSSCTKVISENTAVMRRLEENLDISARRRAADKE